MDSAWRFRMVATAAALFAALASCAPSPQYLNVNHPEYGAGEFDKDNAQCRGANSTERVVPGYDDKIVTTVDEPKAAACLAERGWRPK